MARRKKRGGRRGKKAIPIGQTLTVAVPVVKGFQEAGVSIDGAVHAMNKLTGVNVSTGAVDWHKAVGMAVLLIGESTIGRRAATVSGANRFLMKLTGGWIKLF